MEERHTAMDAVHWKLFFLKESLGYEDFSATVRALHPRILPERGDCSTASSHLRPSPLNTIEGCDASIKETSFMHEIIHQVQSRREVGVPVDFLEGRHGLGTEQSGQHSQSNGLSQRSSLAVISLAKRLNLISKRQ